MRLNENPKGYYLRNLFFHSLTFIMVTVLTACSNSLYRAAIDVERWRAGMTERTLTINDLRFSYLDGGTGEIILMIHGFGANKDSWNRFARYLTDSFRVIAIDLPGHGDSTSDDEWKYDFESQVSRLSTFIDRIGIDRFHIIGNSMGGVIAINYTHQNPERTITLGLMNSGGVLSPTKSEYMHLLEKGINPLLVNSRDEFDNMLAFVMAKPPYIPWFVKDAVYEQYMKRQSINEKIFRDISTQETIKTSLLSKVDIPVFIIWGKQDRVLDVSSVAKLEKSFPRSYSVILEDAGHAPMVEKPKTSAAHYTKFLKKLKR